MISGDILMQNARNSMQLRSKSIIQSVFKAYQILELFGQNNQLCFGDIKAHFNMPVATLYRFLSTLTACGLLTLDNRTKQYSLGPSIIYLGSVAISSINIVNIAHPFMESLKEKTGETISLFVRRGLSKICIAKVESNYSIRYSTEIGKTTYLHGGASGNILMAGMTSKELDMLEQKIGFPKLTQYTITDRKKIEEVLAKTRKDGVWVSYKERSEDTGGIGVPIYDCHGQIVASLNITLPAIRFDMEKIKHWIPLLKQAGAEISHRNGYYTDSLSQFRSKTD